MANKGFMWQKNNIGFALVTRSGSQVIFKELIKKHYPEASSDFINTDTEWKPIINVPEIKDLSITDCSNLDFAVIVRDPVERFKNSCLRLSCSVEEGLNNLDSIHFMSLKKMGVLDCVNAKYFPYSDSGLNACCTYLGLDVTVSLPEDGDMPVLSQEQINLVKQAYSYDCEAFSKL